MWAALCAIAFFFHSLLFLGSFSRNFVTYDEVGHVPAGLACWQTGTFSLYRVNPPLPRALAALPLLAAAPKSDYTHLLSIDGVRNEMSVGRDFAEANATRYLWLMFLARLPGLAWSLLGCWIVYRWASELHGGAGACLAVVLWCIDPTVLGHAQLATPDVPATAAGVAATYVFWFYLRRPSWTLALAAGTMLGVAQLTKFTLLILYPVWAVLWLAFRVGRPDGLGRLSKGSLAGQAALGLIVSVYVINLGYLFAGTCQPLDEYSFISETLTGGRFGNVDNRFRGHWLARLPVPLPSDYVSGIDTQRESFENRQSSYLAGERRRRGWWYYYAYALAVKEPLGLLALVIWGAGLTVARPGKGAWLDGIVPLFAALGLLVFVSSQTGLSRHMRYVLPSFPFLFICAARLGVFLDRGRLVAGATVVALAAWAVAASLSVYPHSLSYFNEAAGGPENGPAHLDNSNIDWGQDLLFLRDWLSRHPEARPIHLAYCGGIDPRFAGLSFSLPPIGPAGPDWAGPPPGWYAVSVNYLLGSITPAPDGKGGIVHIPSRAAFAYFRRLRPVARAGYSIYIYHVQPGSTAAELPQSWGGGVAGKGADRGRS